MSVIPLPLIAYGLVGITSLVLAYVTSVDKGTSSMPPAIIPGTASPSPAIEEPASEGGRRKRRSKHQKRSYKSKTQKHR